MLTLVPFVFKFKSITQRITKYLTKEHKGKNSIWMTFSTAPIKGSEFMRILRSRGYVRAGK